ncbi:phospho-N-acetylmuramoyl-pentapeptide-transferase [Patescibacteria group bacterium]
MIIDVVKVLTPWIFSFFIGIILTPFLTHYLYKYKMWKKKAGNVAGLGGGGTPIFNELHKEKEVGTPRMGGIIIWGTVLITTLLFWLLAQFFPETLTEKLNFLSRDQTWLPLFTLVVASLVGLADDLLLILQKGKYLNGGLSLKLRLVIVSLLGLVGALWFYNKLEVSSVLIPFVGEWELGLLFIPFFIFVMVTLFSGGIIDGIDGLAGGVMASIFTAYAGIAFFQGQIDLAVFCSVIVGGILAFLWFNIPPARFYMGETGMLGLTTTLAVVAFLTGQVLVLPIIAFPLLATTGSSVLQVLSKKLRGGKKIFLVAPVHHHFEAIGWPNYKVTMRYWVISIIFAILGTVIALVG